MIKGAMNILLVEDDDVAAESVVRSLKKYGMDFPIAIAADGLDALAILRNTHPNLTIAKPFIILLDLNMPRMNGFEFLTEVRKDPQLKECVIFVLTTSDAETDRTRAYHENIAGYMVKSAVGPQFAKLATLLDSYSVAVRLPYDNRVII
jgi:CheY-like chemotaxis protein